MFADFAFATIDGGAQVCPKAGRANKIKDTEAKSSFIVNILF
jgi:hypothetical protein